MRIKQCCKATFLVVEDNHYNVIPLRLILKGSFNAEIDRAKHGREAVAMFEKDLKKTCCDVRYQIVLMDINMPVMNGYDATRNIIAL